MTTRTTPSEKIRNLLVTLTLSILLGTSARAGVSVGGDTAFVRGDFNADQRVDLSDASNILNFTFSTGPAPSCLRTADANGDGSAADIADAIYILLYRYGGGSQPPAPFPSCGVSPTADAIPCDSYTPCTGSGEEEYDFGEWIDTEEPSVADKFPPMVLVANTVASAGDPVDVEIVGVDQHAPAFLEWGDGSIEPVLEDGWYSHVYNGEQEFNLRLVNRWGEPHGETAIFVAPPLTVFDVAFAPILPDGQTMPGMPGQVEPFEAHPMECWQMIMETPPMSP